jgi:vacuolar-type H+-ATPase catalytic subunit A/Vma1
MTDEHYSEFESSINSNLKFDHHYTFQTLKEMNNSLKEGNQNLSNLIVDIALQNLNTSAEEIPIVTILVKEDDIVYDVIIDRIDMAETLEQNLDIMEEFEDYERCQKITDALYYLKTK